MTEDYESFDRDGNLLPFQEGLVMGPNGPRAADSWEMPQRNRTKSHGKAKADALEVEKSDD